MAKKTTTRRAAKKQATKPRGRAAKKVATPVKVVRTLGEVARHFERSLNTIKKDWRPSWPEECGKAGAWNVEEITKWRTLQQQRAPGGIDAASDVEVLRRKRAAEARVKEAEARRRERENKLAEAKVCYREDVEGFLAEYCRMTRDLHKRLAEDMKPEFPKRVRRQLTESLDQRCAALLAALHAQACRLVDLDDA